MSAELTDAYLAVLRDAFHGALDESPGALEMTIRTADLRYLLDEVTRTRSERAALLAVAAAAMHLNEAQAEWKRNDAPNTIDHRRRFGQARDAAYRALMEVVTPIVVAAVEQARKERP